MLLHENPYSVLDTDEDRDEEKEPARDKDSQLDSLEQNVYELPFDVNRTGAALHGRAST